MEKDLIKLAKAATTVHELIVLARIAYADRLRGMLDDFELRAAMEAVESRLVLDCNVDLTPYSEGNREAQ